VTSCIFWIHRLDLAHCEQFLAEAFRKREIECGKIPAKHVTAANGDAKPDAGVSCPIHRSMSTATTKISIVKR